jgi:hypothetical protein
MKKNMIEAACAAMLPWLTGMFTIPLVMGWIGSPVTAKQSFAASSIFAAGRFVLYFMTRTIFSKLGIKKGTQ